MARFLLLLSLFILLSADVLAQNYLPVARLFGVDDGLPHRSVNCILQDRQGFIWVATESGVARFDGLRFKIFNKADNGLSSDQIRWMVEDAVGNLWLISSTLSNVYQQHITSVDILNPLSGKIIPLEQYTKAKPPVPLKNLTHRYLLHIGRRWSEFLKTRHLFFWYPQPRRLGQLASRPGLEKDHCAFSVRSGIIEPYSSEGHFGSHDIR